MGSFLKLCLLITNKMKFSRNKIQNIIFFVLIGVLIVSQTRCFIQVIIHSGLALFSPSIIDMSKHIEIKDYD